MISILRKNISDNEQVDLTDVMDSEENNGERKRGGANDRKKILALSQKEKNHVGKKTKRNNN